MRTKVFGEQKDTLVLEHYNNSFSTDIKCPNSIVKLWFSDGTCLGIKYGKDSKLFPNIWNIRILNKGSLPHRYEQCFQDTLSHYSDVFETEAWLTNYKVIPRSSYSGEDVL